MPAQPIAAARVPALPRNQHGWRLFFLFIRRVADGAGFDAVADLLWRTGWSASRTVLLVCS